MLHLRSTTSPAWLRRARAHLDEILLDHAHCEKKAAGAAIKLLFSYPHHRFLQEPVADLAREELDHFQQVLGLLDRRGIHYRTLKPAPYGSVLHEGIRRDEPERLVDVLLISALIEARSCERFQILTEGLAETDPELAALYGSLLASEARHHRLYLDLAARLVDRGRLAARLDELSRVEAEIIAKPCDRVRLHAG